MLNTHISHQIYAKLSVDATNNQKKIIEKLSAWLAGEDFERIFLLNGYAGTGKTTILAALNTDRSIEAIALETGYKNPSHFHKIFKQTYGVSPSEYRKSTNII